MKPDASRTAYDGKLIGVTVERWGEHEREIVEHPGAVAIVAVDARDNVVLVRQLREHKRGSQPALEFARARGFQPVRA